ncbi:uncharacterized protein LOC114009312 [Tupaia chinensis]|uniref:uncharacterized protein LOC114009312 n=1 Tax=Tupaia chinensis TaxID=246437 RepID=UPI000FFC42D4|nr:uncharacterized protein LOC114009312 [Tupaia chinensis]
MKRPNQGPPVSCYLILLTNNTNEVRTNSEIINTSVKRPVGVGWGKHTHSFTGLVTSTYIWSLSTPPGKLLRKEPSRLALQESQWGQKERRPAVKREPFSRFFRSRPDFCRRYSSRMLSSLCMMTCPRTCTRILGLSLGTAALFAAGANMALLFPDWDVTYLWRGLIGRHAMLGTGFWGGGIMVSAWGSLVVNSPSITQGGTGTWYGRSELIPCRESWC